MHNNPNDRACSRVRRILIYIFRTQVTINGVNFVIVNAKLTDHLMKGEIEL